MLLCFVLPRLSLCLVEALSMCLVPCRPYQHPLFPLSPDCTNKKVFPVPVTDLFRMVFIRQGVQLSVHQFSGFPIPSSWLSTPSRARPLLHASSSLYTFRPTTRHTRTLYVLFCTLPLEIHIMIRPRVNTNHLYCLCVRPFHYPSSWFFTFTRQVSIAP